MAERDLYCTGAIYSWVELRGELNSRIGCSILFIAIFVRKIFRCHWKMICLVRMYSFEIFVLVVQLVLICM